MATRIIIDNDFFQTLVKSVGNDGNIFSLPEADKQRMVEDVKSVLNAMKEANGADEIVATETFFNEAIQRQRGDTQYPRDFIAGKLREEKFLNEFVTEFDEANSGLSLSEKMRARRVLLRTSTRTPPTTSKFSPMTAHMPGQMKLCPAPVYIQRSTS